MIPRLYENLIMVLRPALGASGAAVPEGMDALQWREVYDLASKHKVQGLMQLSLSAATPEQTAKLPVDVAARLVSDALAIEACHKRHSETAVRLKRLWEERDVDARMIKGLQTAKFYPCPQSRVLGDIDWWIARPGDWGKALEAVKDLKPKKDSDGDVNFVYEGIVVELHHKGPSCPGAEGELELLADHVLHHATVFGAELRQICDYAVARNAVEGSLCSGPRKWRAALDSLSDYIMNEAVPNEDAEKLLGMTLGGSTVAGRALFFLRVAPGAWLKRIAGLAVGRIKKYF